MRFILGVVFVLLMSVEIMADRGFDVVPQEMQEEQRVALVIGNSSYQRPLSVLNNTINDARAIKNILSGRGFDVIYREDISKRDFSNVLEEFYQKLGRGGVGLLYFSGHGLESSGQNYLIPTDAKIRAKSDTEFEAIALNKITKRMQSMGNRLNIVILDACRNDPFARSVGEGGLAKAEPIGLFVSYATGAGKVASDGVMGENGLFTKYLIEYMQQPLTLQKVFQKTRKSVYSASSKSQFPAIYDQTINGDFYFTLPTKTRPKPTPVVINKPKPVIQPIIQHLDSQWITIKNSICIENNGKINKYGACSSNWNNAKKICDNIGGVLPTIETLKEVVLNCKGILYQSTINKKNKLYKACYQKKGFSPNAFWSSSIHRHTHWSLDFWGGDQGASVDNSINSVSCIKRGKEYKWVIPSDDVCRKNKGIIDRDEMCTAHWQNAKKICVESGGNLPTYRMLKDTIINCGGDFNYGNSNSNVSNSKYHSCYKKMGFDTSDYYWSSNTKNNSIHVVRFGNKSNTALILNQDAYNYVRCVKSKK